MGGMLIKGGSVVDGTGAPAFKSDVRVKDGLIAEIGQNLTAAAGERVIDAAGCIVSPGFIESHTHFDATMWWAPDMDPLPGYGVTTSIMGNCGFSAAPLSADPKVREAVQNEVIGIFSFFEDIPAQPFKEKLTWDWNTWSEYKKSMEAHVKTATNTAAFVGHIPLRLAVLGLDAWDRAATPDELKQMCALLHDALAAGAMGLSTNVLDHDGSGRPVPTFAADDAEWNALFDVLEQYPAAQFQVSLDIFIHQTAAKWIEKLATLLGDRKIRVQWAGGIPTLQFQQPLLKDLEELKKRYEKEGKDFWTGYAHIPVTSSINVQQSLMFAQSDEFVWHEVVECKSQEEKLAKLKDPEWRARARYSWDHKAHPWSPFGGQRMILLDSENGVGPVNITVPELAKQTGKHGSDALADWLIANGLFSTIHMMPFEMMDDVVEDLLMDPMTIGNISDAPAHGQMLCGGGENMILFSTWVKDKKRISVEQAVHVQTGKLARAFNFADRGELKTGKRADITIFNIDEIDRREMKKVYDVPDGKGGFIWRWTRDAAPVRYTIVNGEVTFENGAFTGALPGEVIGPQLVAAH
jgi:N-acyl-D-amino-acid deacylase